jgi:hypothetical protein
VARYAVSQPEKLAEEVVLCLGKDRHIHCRPAARQHGAERDHHHIEKIVASGAARSWIFQFGKTGVEAAIFPPPPRAAWEDCQLSTLLSKSHIKFSHNINNISTIHQGI